MAEFALIAPAFLLLALGIITFGFIFYYWNAANHAANETARWAAVDQNPYAPAGATPPGAGGETLQQHVHDSFPGNDACVHTDARDDNFLLTRRGDALLCDWNWPSLGPIWLDAVDLLVSAYGDGLDADAILAEHPLTRDANPDHVDAWLAMLAGFMLEARERPVPSTSPYLRVHSNWWAEATWAWLASRRGWS